MDGPFQSVEDAIAKHRALTEADEALFDDAGQPLVDDTDTSARAVAAAFGDLMASPCYDRDDVKAKADYILHGTVGNRTSLLHELTGPEGEDPADPNGPLVTFLKSIVMAPPAHTIEQMAKLDFEEWDIARKGESTMTRKWWADFINEWFPIISLANAALFRSKAELIQGFVDEGDAFMGLADDTKSVVEKLRGIADVLDAAHSRLLIAGAAASFDPKFTEVGEAA